MITIFTIVYNDYDKYLPQWVENVKKAHPTDILVIGDVKTDVRNIKVDESIGYFNTAVKNITTEYALMVDVDDILLPNAVEQILKQNADVIALKYIERYKGIDTIKQSGTITKDTMNNWKQISTPGYYAFKRVLNGEIMYYDKVSVPKFPHLFKLANRGAKMVHTDEVCVIYNRVREHKAEDIKRRTEIIEERLEYYK